ncbi:hypothetical protein P1P68_03475 [Streptomyces scabiei]|uniref:hypothetical protein n=1 Tax=Streptomyces scabiei TaxID=1930 RepID=UPI00298F5D36|nr:hypothetical protein [Streptomyces scabiei]MDW8803874.1 hypothetical protein [Streptomyces scabiei]
MLSIAGRSIDFVHWYPGGATTADLLNSPSRIAGVRFSLRSLIAKYAGSRAASLEIAVTETDAVGSPALSSQSAALFASNTYMTWFEHGATHVNWWNLHNDSGEAPHHRPRRDQLPGRGHPLRWNLRRGCLHAFRQDTHAGSGAGLRRSRLTSVL